MKTMIGEVEKMLLDRGVYVRCDYLRYEDGKPYACNATLYQGSGHREGEVVGQGRSTCHPKDNFWKKKGRHMAICRAAKSAGLL